MMASRTRRHGFVILGIIANVNHLELWFVQVILDPGNRVGLGPGHARPDFVNIVAAGQMEGMIGSGQRLMEDAADFFASRIGRAGGQDTND